MLGLILAGGTGSRLGPITKVVSKQLLPIHDKPMIYYPISLLMASGIREFVIISTPRDLVSFQNLLGDGSSWGVKFQYVLQEKPVGLPDAFLVSEKLIGGRPSTLILGDNLFYGSGLGRNIHSSAESNGATVYGYFVDDVSPFGTFNISKNGEIESLVEKPAEGGRGYAIPGIYHFDGTASERTRKLKPSSRGELEIVDLMNSYLVDGMLTYKIIDRGTAWLDTGSVADMNLASELIRVVQSRQGMLIGSPEEVAFRNHWIDSNQLEKLANLQSASAYGKSLLKIVEENEQF